MGLSVHGNHNPTGDLLKLLGKKAPDDLEGVICSDAGPCFPSVITLHGPHSGLLRCILSPWCHSVDNDHVVVV